MTSMHRGTRVAPINTTAKATMRTARCRRHHRRAPLRQATQAQSSVAAA